MAPTTIEAVHATEETFAREVLESDKRVLVDFWADWCAPCHLVAPVLSEIAADHADDLRLVKVNVDEEPGLAGRYGVMSLPTMVLFDRGEPVAATLGAQPKRALERALGLADG